MRFKRKLKTSDSGADVSLDKPVHLVFPYSGGPMFGTGFIGKHKETPVITDKKINLNQICKGIFQIWPLKFRDGNQVIKYYIVLSIVFKSSLSLNRVARIWRNFKYLLYVIQSFSRRTRCPRQRRYKDRKTWR